MQNASPRKTTLLLADPYPVVRHGIRTCLAAMPHLEVTAEISKQEEIMTQCRKRIPHILILDVENARRKSLDDLRALYQAFPGIKILIFTAWQERDFVLEALRLGVQGYLLKDTPPEDLRRAVDALERGEVFLSPDIIRMVLHDRERPSSLGGMPMPISKLSPREQEVLTLVAEGHTNKKIAKRLNLSVRTVETHRLRIMRKLDIHNAAGLTRYAVAKGIVPLP